MGKKARNEYPRVLVISNNSFSSYLNNGKTLASFFKKIPQENIAQLYFNAEFPTDTEFNNYFRITDVEILKSIVMNKNPGALVYSSNEKKIDMKNQGRYGLILKLRKYEFFRILREIAWSKKGWKTKELNEWVDDFNPEIIFLCAGDSGFSYDISEYFQAKYEAKVIVYITDDYILPRKKASPFWWLRRNYIFKKMKNTIKSSDLFVTISEEMRITYKELFNRDSILAMNIPQSMKSELGSQIARNPEEIILVYAGGLHFNRFKTIRKISKAIYKYNLSENNKKVFLKVYSGEKLSKNIERQLNIAGASKYCGSLNQAELKIALNESDIPVHVESFDKKSIESTRLSISTKIPEYLSLGKPILAVGPHEVASMRYLKDTAYCINNDNQIYPGLVKILEDAHLQSELAKKSLEKYESNHDSEIVLDKLTKKMMFMDN